MTVEREEEQKGKPPLPCEVSHRSLAVAARIQSRGRLRTHGTNSAPWQPLIQTDLLFLSKNRDVSETIRKMAVKLTKTRQG